MNKKEKRRFYIFDASNAGASELQIAGGKTSSDARMIAGVRTFPVYS